MTGRLYLWCRSVLLLCAFAALLRPNATAEVSVKFLDHAPVIDGVLDENLATLPVQQFPVFASPDNFKPAWKPSYRIAYGTGFLYLYIEVPDEEVLTRDRAYQNGDGFQLALTTPRENDAPADEFYVLGFTTANKPAAAWQKKFSWYRNIDLSFQELKSAVVTTQSSAGKTGIELLLPWSEVYPYHPWLSHEIGFNLCYVKGFGAEQKTYFFVVQDDHLQSEQSPRLYMRLRFEPPALAEGTQAYSVLVKNQVARGERVQARVAVLTSAEREVALRAGTWSGEGTPLQGAGVTVHAVPGLSVHTIEVPAQDLPEGGYSVSWGGPIEKVDARVGFSVLPAYDADALSARLDGLAGKIKAGSITTLRYQLEAVRRTANSLRPYDTAAQLRLQVVRLLDAIGAAEKGKDVIAEQSGTFRRAYRSKLDGTLQPYSVRIPAPLEPGKKYPLLVYLHGSGEDERGQLRPGLFPDSYIQLAPRGRGTSNGYTVDHAQNDIAEAIDDVMANYPIDRTRVVLAGFSMGGYGVYRTFYEDPQRYHALVVISGHPTFGREEFGPEHPSFLEDKYLAAFRGVPLFVFHGGQDRNCPIELTRELLRKLNEVGAKVEFHYEEDKGHEIPSEATLHALRDWLDTMAK